MIPAHPPYVARFGDRGTLPVVAWSADGDALVVDYARGALRPASTLPGFSGVVEAPAPIVAVVPGGGWMARYTLEKGAASVEPVLAWAFDCHGCATAMVATSDGTVEPVDELKCRPELFHPDERRERNGGTAGRDRMASG